MKKVLALVLSLALLLSLAAIPGTAEEAPTKIRWLHKAWNASTELDHFWDAYWVKHLEEKFNVEIDFGGLTPSDDYDAIVNLTIADSGNWPDLIFWNWDNYSGGIASAIEDGLVLPLNHVENWEEDMPNFSQLLKDNAYIRRALTLDNGDVTGCSHVEQDVRRNAYSGFGIRADWLENVGMDMPTTTEELYEVLKAFKEQDANGNGQADEIPMSDFKEYFLLKLISGGWDLVWDSMQIDPVTGDIAWWATVNNGENFKKFATDLRKWYAEGLFDPEFNTQDTNARIVKILNDQVGFFFSYPGEGDDFAERIRKAGLNDKAAFEAMGPLTDANGNAYTSNTDMVKWAAAEQLNVVTTATGEKTHLILQMLDYMYSDEFTDILSWGKEGVTFEYDENGVPHFLPAAYNEDGSFNEDFVNIYALGGRGQWPRFMNWEYEMLNGTDLTLKERTLWGDVDTTIVLPPLTVTGNEAVEYTSILSDAKTATLETFINVVLGNADVFALDTLDETLKTMKIDRAIEILQAAYDNYEKK